MNFSIFWALKSLTSSPLIIKWSYPHFSSSRPSHMLCLTINKHKLPIISVSITPSYDHHLLSFQRTLLLLPQLFNTSRANKWLIPVFYLCPLFPPYLKSMVYYYNLYKTHLQLLALSWFPDSFSENISWKTSDLYSLSTSMAEQDGRKKKKKIFHITLLISVATLSFQLVGSNIWSHLWLCLSFTQHIWSTSRSYLFSSKHIQHLTTSYHMSCCNWIQATIISSSSFSWFLTSCLAPLWLFPTYHPLLFCFLLRAY